ncbi:MAG: hypothetical protein GY699_07280 [Desulfobacteraceae bacterium]|nr:hypothetical protein [Desulfobacteraceae bacterium]
MSSFVTYYYTIGFENGFFVSKCPSYEALKKTSRSTKTHIAIAQYHATCALFATTSARNAGNASFSKKRLKPCQEKNAMEIN